MQKLLQLAFALNVPRTDKDRAMMLKKVTAEMKRRKNGGGGRA